MQTIDLDIAPRETPAASAMSWDVAVLTLAIPAADRSRRVRSGSLDETTAGGRDETGRAVPPRPSAA